MGGPVPSTPTATVATLAPTAEAASKEGDRPFQCHEPGCGRRFNRKFTLSEHMKTHTGEKPYVCPVVTCSKRFSTSGNLARHKRLHSSIKPFECSIDGCKRSFPNELKLQQHLKIHLGGKTHMCKAFGCGKSFSTAGNLTRHMKNHHHGAMSDLSSDEGHYYHHSQQYGSAGSMSIFHNPNDVHSPVSVANSTVMSDHNSLYSQATHVPLTSYANLSSQTPPPMPYNHTQTSQPSMANLYYSFNQGTVPEMSTHHHQQPQQPHMRAGYGSASFQQPMYDDMQPMQAMHPHDGHPQNLFDDVIQFQLAHPRLV